MSAKPSQMANDAQNKATEVKNDAQSKASDVKNDAQSAANDVKANGSSSPGKSSVARLSEIPVVKCVCSVASLALTLAVTR